MKYVKSSRKIPHSQSCSNEEHDSDRNYKFIEPKQCGSNDQVSDSGER